MSKKHKHANEDHYLDWGDHSISGMIKQIFFLTAPMNG